MAFGDPPDATACSIHCDASSGSPCATGLHCLVLENPDAPGILFTHCGGATGTGTQGASCVEDADCALAHFCADAGGPTNECIRMCVVGGAAVCSGLTMCNSFAAPGAMVGTTEYGYCL